MKHGPLKAGLAALLAVVLGAGAAEAQAYTAAKVEAQVRPDFGRLLRPALRGKHRPDRPWRGRYDRGRRDDGAGRYPGRYPDDRRPSYGNEDSITVDCGDPSLGPTPISDAARWLRDGGVVYVRARGVACKETIELDHPVIVAAEEIPAFSTDPAPSPVTLAPADGQPCVLVAQGVKEVELRGLTLVAERAGQQSCVQSWDAEVALVRVDIRYAGDGSAVFASGGKLIMRESRIEAHTYDAAVVTENAGIDFRKVRVRADAIGLDLTLGPEESLLRRVGVVHGRSGQPGSVGIVVRAQRSGGSLLRVDDAVICGWRVGLSLERAARAEVRRSRVCRSSVGLVSEGDLGVTESAIGARQVGVYVVAGQARVVRNRIYDLDAPASAVLAETGAGLVVEPNWLYLRAGCDRFDWNGRQFCRPGGELPGSLRDESFLDRDYREGWDADGYEDGYSRDGAVAPFDRPVAPEQRRRRGRQLSGR